MIGVYDFLKNVGKINTIMVGLGIANQVVSNKIGAVDLGQISN